MSKTLPSQPGRTAPGTCYSPSGFSDGIAFAHAFAECCDGEHPDECPRLRDATTAIVERMKQDGATPECVIIAMKQAIREHSITHVVPSLVSDKDDQSANGHVRVYERVFGWFLAAYYGST
jgi:hypothetical protein